MEEKDLKKLLEIEKLRIDNKKIETEIKILTLPFYSKLSFYATMVPLILLVIGFYSADKNGWFEAMKDKKDAILAKTQADVTKAEADIQKAKATLTKTEAIQIALESESRILVKDNENLKSENLKLQKDIDEINRRLSSATHINKIIDDYRLFIRVIDGQSVIYHPVNNNNFSEKDLASKSIARTQLDNISNAISGRNDYKLGVFVDLSPSVTSQYLRHSKYGNVQQYKYISFNSINFFGNDIPDLIRLKNDGFIFDIIEVKVEDSTAKSIEFFSDISKLKRLVILRPLTRGLSSKGYEHLPNSNLVSLEISFEDLNENDFKNIGATPYLESVLFHNSKIDNYFIHYLNRLSRLKELSLYDTNLTDEGLESIGTITTLEELRLSYGKITNNGISSLKRLDNLEKLFIHSRSLGDEALIYIREMKSLKYLSLDCKKMTLEKVAKLQKILPNCVIEFDHKLL